MPDSKLSIPGARALVSILVISTLNACAGAPHAGPGAHLASPGGPGPVIAVGGGGTPDAVPLWALDAAAQRFSSGIDVVVVPHASGRETRGEASVRMWQDAGATSVELLGDDPDTARSKLEAAEVIWMGGGSQTRLLAHLREHDLVEAIRGAHLRGAVVGGTSAGAAVLGSVAIAGSPDPAPYVNGAMERTAGLGLVPDTIVDQHFAERRREGRLMTALFEGGVARGLGVSEGTAAIVEAGSLQVLGRGTVLLFDAAELETAPAEDGGLMMGQGLCVDLVRTGARRDI